MNYLDFKPIDILIVEDNPGDARLIIEVLSGKIKFNSLHVAGDGEEAIDFLHKKGRFSKVPYPDLIFLDLNLPKLDGREVLAKIKSDDKFKHIPVVVMTMSEDEQDILKSYSLHANCYIKKPLDLDQFIKVIESLEDFWFSVVKLPGKK